CYWEIARKSHSCPATVKSPDMSPSGMEIGRYSVASVYFAGFSSAFFAQSSQQTVISLPPTLTLIPPSLMSQSHTGHFLVFFISSPFSLSLSFAATCKGAAGVSDEEMIVGRGKSDFQILAHFAKRSAAGVASHVGGRAAELAAKGVGEVAVAGK